MISQGIEKLKHKLHIVILYPQLFTSPIVNILTPLQYLVEQHLITLDHYREDNVTPEQVGAADVVIACRSVSPIVRPVYEYAKALGIPIIYDLDDNLFAVPEDSDVYRYFGHPDKQRQLQWMLKNAALVRVHSPTLVDVVRPLNENIQVVWGTVDWTLTPKNLPDLRKPPEIVYAVSPESGAMFYSIIRDDLKRVLLDYGDSVRFYMLGYKEPELAKLPNCIYVPFENDYQAFFKDFTQHGYAIGLAPMKHDLFYQCKTDIKFRDYAAAGAVGIFTDSPLYQQVQHNVTGIIVQNEPGNWYTAIVRLLENPQLMEAIRQEARRFALQRYHVINTSQHWFRDLQTVERKTGSAEIIHPEDWWFTQTSNQMGQKFPVIRDIYNHIVPFKLHVVISRIYHRARRFLIS